MAVGPQLFIRLSAEDRNHENGASFSLRKRILINLMQAVGLRLSHMANGGSKVGLRFLLAESDLGLGPTEAQLLPCSASGSHEDRFG